MLMTELKGDLAVSQSKALIRTFKAMKDYLQRDPLLIESSNFDGLSLQVSENTKEIGEIKEMMVTKDAFPVLRPDLEESERVIDEIVV